MEGGGIRRRPNPWRALRSNNAATTPVRQSIGLQCADIEIEIFSTRETEYRNRRMCRYIEIEIVSSREKRKREKRERDYMINCAEIY